ncbi:MAG TPA: acyl-CoA dehydrogenase family protein, partial [Actinomycetota bacterium]|nr:acyl-CoA dehydrogenase family protein [Actinomycetota bacterium]
MDLDLDPDLEAFRASARDFARREIAPRVEEAEKTERTPREVFLRAGAAGFLGIRYPEEVGGSAASCLAETILREEFARVCSGISAALSVSSHLGTYPIHAFGTAEQQQRYLVPALRGEKVSAFALTEPDAGSDVRGIKTRARRTSGGWVLKGRKTFITNAPIADFMIVVAYTDPEAGTDGMGLFIVDLPDDKVTITRLHKMGHLSSEIGEVALDDVEVTEDACLGGDRGAWKRVMSTLGIGRVVVSGGAVGLAQEAVDLAVAYAGEREAFGRPIGANQGVSFPLARAEAAVDAARLAVYRAAWLFDQERNPVDEVSAAKYLAGEAALQAVDTAIRVFGGYGYMREYPVERLYRDARYFPIVEGTGEIHQRVMASR